MSAAVPQKGTEEEQKLWVNQSVQSIRDVEKQTRQQTEDKKEELRQLVGRRYRVLIESADWMVLMKDMSESALTNLENVSNAVQRLEDHRAAQSHARRTTNSNRAAASSSGWCEIGLHDRRRGLAKAIRLLVQAPEEIWAKMKANDYLEAADLYFRALGVHDWLLEQKDAGRGGAGGADDADGADGANGADGADSMEEGGQPRLCEAMVLVSQHMCTVKQFLPRLIRCCRQRLYARNLLLEEYGSALCTTWLVGNFSLQQVVDLYFESRTAWMVQVLDAADKYLQAKPQRRKSTADAVKAGKQAAKLCTQVVVGAVEDVARTLQMTITHAYVLFGPASAARAQRFSSLSRERPQSPAHRSGSISGRPGPSTPRSPGGAASGQRDAVLNVCARMSQYQQRQSASFMGLIRQHHSPASTQQLSLAQLQQQGTAWLAASLLLVERRTTALLQHLTHGSQIGHLRDVLIDCLSTGRTAREKTPRAAQSAGRRQSKDFSQTDGDENQARERVGHQEWWKQACLSVVGRSVNLWTEAFLLGFSARCQQIIIQSFSQLCLDRLLLRALDQLRTTQAGRPSPEDGRRSLDTAHCFRVQPLRRRGDRGRALAGEAGGPAGGEEDDAGEGLTGLMNHEVELICAQFNEQLATLIVDMRHMLTCPALGVSTMGPAGPSGRSTRARAQANAGMLTHFQSLLKLISEQLRPFVQKTCTDKMSATVRALRGRLGSIEGEILELDGATGAGATTLADQALLVARVCARLVESSQALQDIGSLDVAGAQGGQQGGHPRQSALQHTARQAFRVWTRCSACVLGDSLRRAHAAWVDRWQADKAQQIAWPKPDDDTSVSVPSQPSSHMVLFLFELMDELHRVEGYKASPTLLSWVIADLGRSILSVYESFLNDEGARLSEAAAMQLVFDVKFLFAVVRLPSATVTGDPDAVDASCKGRLAAVLKAAEAHVDPIDYAIALPLIRDRIANLLGSSAVMYGALVKLNPFTALHPPATEPAPGLAQPRDQEAGTNILALAPPIARVPALPVALYPLRSRNKDGDKGVEATEPVASLAPAAPALTNTTTQDTGLRDRTKMHAKNFFGKLGLSY